MEIQEKKRTVTLPKRQLFETPRLLKVDAYTLGGNMFQSVKAQEKSTYYIMLRRQLHTVNSTLYAKGDDRMGFEGLDKLLEELFYDPITHEEIDTTVEFLKTFKATALGLANYDFPEELWRTVVDEFNGRPPIRIKAMPNGSIVYPNEPIMQITSSSLPEKRMGELAAWFESTLLKVWASSERLTQNEHWFSKIRKMVRDVEGSEASEEDINFWASLMLTDFGDRAGITNQETERLGYVHLYTFPGTDSCSGAYQAWENANRTPVGFSVNALAHRNVQAYQFEEDCYKAIYDACGDDNFISMVSDCNDFKVANREYLIPLALRSIKENNGKIVVSRPDSGDAKEQVLWLCNLAVENGLYTERTNAKGITWKYATTFKFIEGDGMKWDTMWEIIEALLEAGFAPHGWGLFGNGGGLRNDLKRDNTSAKYALCAKGTDNEGVVKFSETLAKTTLPGPFKVLRDKESLDNKRTIVFEHEEGEDAMVLYFDGSNIWNPFGVGQDDNFLTTRARIREQWDGDMPLNLISDTTHLYPASEAILDERRRILSVYAPNKSTKNY